MAIIHFSCSAFQQHAHQKFKYYDRLKSPSIKMIGPPNLVDDQSEKGSADFLPDTKKRKHLTPSSSSFIVAPPERREFILAMTAVALFLPIQSSAHAFNEQTFTNKKTLEDLQFANGRWDSSSSSSSPSNTSRTRSMETTSSFDITIPAYFITYLTRFLINYDEGVAAWWEQLQKSYLLLSDEEKQNRLGRDFGRLANSLQQALQRYLQNLPTYRLGYEQMFELFAITYDRNNDGVNNKEVRRQLCLLAATLPIDQQPRTTIQKLLVNASISTPISPDQHREDTSLLDEMAKDVSTLLPREYKCVMINPDGSLVIQPSISLYEIGVGEEFGQAATATTFGPLASNSLKRELPRYTFDIYALFGISGATGCAMTHSIVIPLDVIKTRAQTSPESYSTIVTNIIEKEGVSGLLTGAQATLAGYTWYGISVYPSYTFFKRFLGHALSADLAIAHANDIALIAGALAAVIASLGLTPLEAARIRVVSDPARYKTLGLIGTLQVIASEGNIMHGDNDNNGSSVILSSFQSLYKGLPSLMTRQVIFGSVKFLAFERACEAIYLAFPMMRDTTWTALSVSLIAGGFSGALSCFVSQPADAVLTYVSQDNESRLNSGENSSEGLGVLDGSLLMIKENGASSLFRGLGSRSLWAASIISGQFLLYDIFRNWFGVNSEDLSQIFNVNL